MKKSHQVGDQISYDEKKPPNWWPNFVFSKKSQQVADLIFDNKKGQRLIGQFSNNEKGQQVVDLISDDEKATEKSAAIFVFINNPICFFRAFCSYH